MVAEAAIPPPPSFACEPASSEGGDFLRDIASGASRLRTRTLDAQLPRPVSSSTTDVLTELAAGPSRLKSVMAAMEGAHSAHRMSTRNSLLEELAVAKLRRTARQEGSCAPPHRATTAPCGTRGQSEQQVLRAARVTHTFTPLAEALNFVKWTV